MDFLIVFQKWNSHMMLIQVDDVTYSLSPPNQCDWFYTFVKLSDTSWKVMGKKNDVINGLEEEIEYNVELVDGKWVY